MSATIEDGAAQEPMVMVPASTLQRLALLTGWFGARHRHGTLDGVATEESEDCWGCQELQSLRALAQRLEETT